ncbi:DsbA family oxidoreductase [Halalkalibacter nanhaiisediminis]|uniref:Putative DsbA family dithiol-disulfide isomerase n=1 Tax=Halalkalibacter nanhaiisediminis TaxID=688079 RepID=A0A562QQK0_9BACI|nr:DsbA family protein [Halalkalibacter nanhaiisediminis]TWI59032.1 putative DsbA family dithiol-disulfide isomerase [Halalkalibacter nanhaiisediminis]
MRKLEIFFDYNCPFCYTEVSLIDDFKGNNVEIEWKTWRMPVNANPPEKPTGYMEEAKQYLKELAKRKAVTIKPPSEKRNTRLAHIGAKFAKDNGCFEAYHKRIFQAIWNKDENIEDRDVLSQIAEEVGLSKEIFKNALVDPNYVQQVEEDIQEAEDKKIWTIPSYIGNNGEIQVHHFKDLPSLEKIGELI